MRKAVLSLFVLALPLIGYADTSPSPPSFYRELVSKIRSSAEFKVPMPAGGDMEFSYLLKLQKPVWDEPIVSDVDSLLNPVYFHRSFWEKVFASDDSYIRIGGEELPLTCIHVSGQDNRYSGKAGPLFPEFVLRVYLVANDYTCQGPIKPGWPASGGRKEAWDTYLYYEITDPTIMLPTEAHVRYRNVEFPAVLVDRGPQ